MKIEAITLVGNFGVYGQIEQGDSSNTYQGKDFYIDTQKKEIKSLINDGFPFFRGPITLTQDISFKDKAILDIPERFQLIDVSINNEYMGRMMFNHQLEIDNKSNNEFVKLSLTLYVSNRNLCGPNHNEPDEVFAVGPYSWEHFDRDENRLLKEYDTKDYYTFVKTII